MNANMNRTIMIRSHFWRTVRDVLPKTCLQGGSQRHTPPKTHDPHEHAEHMHHATKASCLLSRYDHQAVLEKLTGKTEHKGWRKWSVSVILQTEKKFNLRYQQATLLPGDKKKQSLDITATTLISKRRNFTSKSLPPSSILTIDGHKQRAVRRLALYKIMTPEERLQS